MLDQWISCQSCGGQSILFLERFGRASGGSADGLCLNALFTGV